MLRGHRERKAAQGWDPQLEPLAQIHAKDSVGVNIYERTSDLDSFRLSCDHKIYSSIYTNTLETFK